MSPPDHDEFGVWESKDGGVNWKLIQKAPKDNLGATDLEMDPQNPKILYSSFWGDAIYKSTDGGKKWKPIMNGLPGRRLRGGQTRFSIAISHPTAAGSGTLYVGLRLGRTATATIRAASSSRPTAPRTGRSCPAAPARRAVEDYCGDQCFYDNVIEVDPTNPDIVFAAGQFNYDIGSGGIFRSDDGGQTWKNLGFDQHPDFHALAFNPANTVAGAHRQRRRRLVQRQPWRPADAASIR